MGKRHTKTPQHYPFLWRFSLEAMKSTTAGFSQSKAQDEVRMDNNIIQFREIVHPFLSGVNDPASLFVFNEHCLSLFLLAVAFVCLVL